MQTAGFSNGSVFVTSQITGALLCARSGEKTALAQSSPLHRSQGHLSRRGAQARIAWGSALQDAVDLTCKRNGGEHARSLSRISRALDTSTKRRCACCIGCAETAARRDGRPKNASTDTGLSDVDISYDQSSRGQKLAALPEVIFERKVQGKTHRGGPRGLLSRRRSGFQISLKFAFLSGPCFSMLNDPHPR
jgi:hypothetical protein